MAHAAMPMQHAAPTWKRRSAGLRAAPSTRIPMLAVAMASALAHAAQVETLRRPTAAPLSRLTVLQVATGRQAALASNPTSAHGCVGCRMASGASAAHCSAAGSTVVILPWSRTWLPASSLPPSHSLPRCRPSAVVSAQPCLGKCQACTPERNECCPGFRCQQSGKGWLQKYYCLPDKCNGYTVGGCLSEGGMCGTVAGGAKCCSGLDCVINASGFGECRRSSVGEGGSCNTIVGQCGAGLICKSGSCVRATCPASPGCAAGDRTCMLSYDLGCQSLRDAACSGLQRP